MTAERAAQCTGRAIVRVGRGITRVKRCGRRTTDPSRRCWQHADQLAIATPTSGETHA